MTWLSKRSAVTLWCLSQALARAALAAVALARVPILSRALPTSVQLKLLLPQLQLPRSFAASFFGRQVLGVEAACWSLVIPYQACWYLVSGRFASFSMPPLLKHHHHQLAQVRALQPMPQEAS